MPRRRARPMTGRHWPSPDRHRLRPLPSLVGARPRGCHRRGPLRLSASPRSDVDGDTGGTGRSVGSRCASGHHPSRPRRCDLPVPRRSSAQVQDSPSCPCCGWDSREHHPAAGTSSRRRGLATPGPAPRRAGRRVTARARSWCRPNAGNSRCAHSHRLPRRVGAPGLGPRRTHHCRARSTSRRADASAGRRLPGRLLRSDGAQRPRANRGGPVPRRRRLHTPSITSGLGRRA